MGTFNSDMITETLDGANVSYILNENDKFSLTEYKVLKNQSKNFIKCSKLLYNGKIKLIYFSAEFKSLRNMFGAIDSDTFITIIANLINALLDIQQNGFLNCNNIDLSYDKIFIDQRNFEINLIYLPVSNEETSSLSFENEFKADIIKLISSDPAYSSEKMGRICSYLSNGTLTLKEVYAKICSEIKGNAGKVSFKNDLKSIDKEKKSLSQPTLYFHSINSSNVEFRINKSEFVIGKNAAAVDGAITFNKAISRIHCKIIYQNNNYYIVDLSSANGTYVNGSRITPNDGFPLSNGDSVRLANSDFKVEF